jgi:hypothetical protein
MSSRYAFQLRPPASIWSARLMAPTQQVVQSLLMPKVLPAVSVR